MRWFRVYGEMPDDPKVGTLDDTEFRTWVELLCLACREETNGVTSACLENANWLLRRNVTGSLQKLLQRNLIHLNDKGFIVITKWDERQKPSDSAKERVRKFREKAKCNVTETEVKRNSNGAEKRRVEKSRVEKKEKKERGIQLADLTPQMFAAYYIQYSLTCGLELELEKFTQYCRSGKGKYTDHKAAFCGWLLRTKGKDYENTGRNTTSGNQNGTGSQQRPASEKQRATAAYAAIIEERNTKANQGLQGKPESADGSVGPVLPATKGLW